MVFTYVDATEEERAQLRIQLMDGQRVFKKMCTYPSGAQKQVGFVVAAQQPPHEVGRAVRVGELLAETRMASLTSETKIAGRASGCRG